MNEDIQKTIFDELDLNGLPEDKKEQLAIKMTEVVVRRIFAETVEKMPETDQETYEKMIDENAAAEELEAFLKEKIPGYDGIAQKVIEGFKEEMKGMGR